mgnify:CR=1 FL=1
MIRTIGRQWGVDKVVKSRKHCIHVEVPREKSKQKPRPRRTTIVVMPGLRW